MSGAEHEANEVSALNLDADRAADWAALEKMAGEGTQAAGAVEAVEAAQVVPDLVSEIAGALEMAVGMLGPMFPSVAKIYTPQVIGGVSGALGAVCKKRGWMPDGLMGEYGEEIACLIVVGPVAVATYKGIQADIAARQPAQPASVPGELDLSASVPVDAPGAKTVTVGVAV